MSNFNKVILLGRLGKDPECKSTQSGQMVANFSLATNDTFSKEKKTEWSNIVVWGKPAEACSKYLRKGSLALVEGRLQTRMWEKDGHKNYVTEIIASSVQFIGSDKAQEAAIEQKSDSYNDIDSIPF